jgi:hypothetical protein
MRALYTLTMRAGEAQQYQFDFNPWLQSIASTAASFTVTDAPDLIESYTTPNQVVVLNITGGLEGKTYRIGVQCTAANGLVRNTTLEVQVLGVAPVDDPDDGEAVNVEDSLTSDSSANAPSIRAVNAALAGKAAASAGLTSAERTKLASVATGATANAADAALRDRATHTGTQAIATVAGLQTALDAKLNAALVGAVNGVAGLGADGKVPSAQLPNIAAATYRGEVANEAAMLAVVANQGDFVTRADLQNTWICIATPSNVLSAWRQLAYPSSPVTSVAGKTGAVALTKADVGLPLVANLAPADLGISTATANALALKAEAVHTHATSSVTGLDAALAAKAASVHTHEIANVTGLQAALNDKAAAAHTQAISTVLGLQTALDGKQPLLAFLLAGAALGAFHTINFGSGFTGAIVDGVLTINAGGDNGYVDAGYVDAGYVSV